MKKEAIEPVTLLGIGLASLSGALAGSRMMKQHHKQRIFDALSKGKLTPEMAQLAMKHGLHVKAASEQERRKKLHHMVRPMAKLYKTKGAKGWDVLADATLGSDSATGASGA